MVRISRNSSGKVVSSDQTQLRNLFRQMLVEGLERRDLMATDTGPRLLSISPNVGTSLDPNATGLTANVLRESPTQIVFRFDGSQSIDPTSLSGIQISRSGSALPVTPAFLGFGESRRIVIARFSEPLPDDSYQIQVFGQGSSNPIRNTLGEALRPAVGIVDTYFMNLELGAKIVAVVPQPTRVEGMPGVSTARNTIEVYFNNDDLNPADAQNPAFYQLIRTGDSVNPSDDIIYNPIPGSIVYDAALDKVTLTFDNAIPGLATGSGTFRLRIGSNQSSTRTTPVVFPLGNDVGDTISTASNVLAAAPLSSDSSFIINEQVTATPANRLALDFPGSEQDPGSRDIQDERALLQTADANPYTTTRYYSFLLNQPYGRDSQGRPVTSAISEVQRQRVREVFEFYSYTLGIQFVETTGLMAPDGSPTLQVVVGDLLSSIVGIPGGPGGFVTSTAVDLNGLTSLAILDGSELWDNDFGYGTQRDNLTNDSIDPTLLTNPLMTEANRSSLFVQTLQTPLEIVGPNFFIESMRVIGSLIGLGQTHDLPPGTIQGFEPLLGRVENPLEQIFPGDQDIARGQHLYRPDNRDVDLYKFTVQNGQRGSIAIQTIAEGLADSSNLDTYVKLYRKDVSGVITLLASNDNYLSSDSLIRFDVQGQAGVEFFIAVTAKGNESFDPGIRGSGSGGLSDGKYQLRVDYRPAPGASIMDMDGTPSALDGDGDGKAGGEFNYWFRTATPITSSIPTVGVPKTIYVDKNATGTTSGIGSLADPYKKIQDAFAIAQPGDIVRVLGVDPSIPLTSRKAYEIGDGGPSKPVLDDGRDLIVPRGVSLMIDAGAVFKFATAQVLVGSDAATSDRSGATIQVLGTPTNSVFFTSYNDETLGVDTNNLPTIPQRGSWGGIEIRNDIDREQGRNDPELSGIFLNYIASADMRFGGGFVGQGSLTRVVDPIHLNSARPTIIHNRITQSADAGISADPASFEETLFTEARYQFTGVFTPDYNRVGPVIRGNRIIDSSINGLLIRIDTLPGQRLETLDVAARLDDTDIVYVLGETLTINGTSGGSVLENVRPDLTRVTFGAVSGGTLPVASTYEYRLTYVDRFGREGVPSNSIFRAGTVEAGTSSIRLGSLPAATGDFVGRRLYRASATGAGLWDLVAELDRSTVSYIDTGKVLISGVGVNSASNLELFNTLAPNVTLTNTVGATLDGGSLTAGTVYSYRVSIVDSLGNEGLPSNIVSALPIAAAITDPFTGVIITPAQNSIVISDIPSAAAGQTRRLYRNDPAVPGRWDLISTSLPTTATTYTDLGDFSPNVAATTATGSFVTGGTLSVGNVYSYQLSIVDSFGFEGLPSSIVTASPIAAAITNPFTGAIVSPAQNAVVLNNLPLVGFGQTRRLYRYNPATPGLWDLVSASIPAANTSFTDTGTTAGVGSPVRQTRGIELMAPSNLRRARPDASLVIDPGIVVKSQGARIEVGINAQLLAEGTANKPIIFTSRADDRYGAGATFDTNNDGSLSVGRAGDWSGILGLHLSTVSLDSAVVTFGGGSSRVPGGFGSFNAIEIYQSDARIANSLIESNASGAGTTTTTRRSARGVNDAAAIYVSGSQPIIVNNVIRNNSVIISDLLTRTFQNGETAAISIDANSMKAVAKSDTGRSIGLVSIIDTGAGNQGPLVSGNRLGGNAINGMRVRGATLTTETVWDDTDIVQVVQKEIVVPDFSIYGGLKLQSRGDESLIVKFSGATAGLTATGRPIGITDRIGGSLQVIGSPGFPVVMTDLSDDTIGAGFDSFGGSMTDTNNNNAASTAVAGGWRGVLLDAYGNDRNIDTTYENEPDLLGANGTNNIPSAAQDIGSLAKDIESGDENVRLGLTLTGSIARPNDVDVYRFTATTGSMVWFDIDRTSGNLDTIVELVDANGRIIALSNNSLDESSSGKVTFYDPNVITDDRIYPLDQSIFTPRNANAPGVQVDFQGTNPLDAGFRVALPGTPGTTNEYFVRVRSSNVSDSTSPSALDTLKDPALITRGLTSGAYRLQLRLQQLDEIGGSTIRYSDIRYATRAINIQGGPLHSPLLGELGQPDLLETETDSIFVGNSGNIAIGNIFNYDRGAVSIAANLTGQSDVDWFSFTINRELASNLDSLKHQSVIFDIDYADALGRPDTSLWVFRATPGGAPQQLILMGRDSDITDDKAAPNRGSNASDITRGSFGSGDAFIGSSELPNGTYVVAVTSNSLSADVLNQYVIANYANPLVRLEPLDSVTRISDDRFSGLPNSTLMPPKQESFPIAPVGSATNIYPNAVPFNLSDVTAFVARDNPAGGAPRTQLLLGNALTGAKEAEGGTRAGGGVFGLRVRDIAGSPEGLLVGPAFEPTTGRVDDSNASRFSRLNADGSAAGTAITNSGIQTIEIVQTAATAFTSRQVRQGTADVGIGMTFTAVTFGDDPTNNLTMFGVAQRGAGGRAGEIFDEAIITPGAGGVATTTGVSPGTGVPNNILYRLDPATQDAVSPTAAGLGDRGGDSRSTGTGTSTREFGVFADIDTSANHYVRRANGFADTIIVRQEANSDIVGIVESGNFIYGVTDQGELWRMAQTSLTNGFRGADLIATNIPTGLTGLTVGPRNLTLDSVRSEFILTTSKRINGGTFQLSFDGETTTSLAYNATAIDIQAALEALLTIGPGNVFVKGGSGVGSGSLNESAISISLIGALAGSPLRVTLAPGNTLSISPFASISKPDPFSDFFRLKIPTNSIGGSYQLAYDSDTAAGTDPAAILPFNATAAQIRAAILAMPSIVLANTPPATPPEVDVQVRQTATGVFDISFIGASVPTGITLDLAAISSIAQPIPGTPTFTITTATASPPIAYYRLQYLSDPAITIASNATPAAVQTAILNSLSIAAANTLAPNSITVTVTSSVAGEFVVTLGGPSLPVGATMALEDSLLGSALPVALRPTVAVQSLSRYSSVLFGVTPNGTIHAFDINGLPQFIFPGGQSSTFTGGRIADGFADSLSNNGAIGTDVQGIDFSILDVNLWHVTSARQADAGHGTLQNFNSSRLNSANAGNSLYFGFRENDSTNGRQPGIWTGVYDLAGQTPALNQTYDLPGGTRGAVESNPINLAGYSPDDQPTLYFNYFLESQNSNSPLTDNANMADAFRVYGYGPDGRWILLATNNSANSTSNTLGRFSANAPLIDEYNLAVSGNQDLLSRSFRTQEVFDQTATGATTWRQARINLAPLAGMEDARIRFEFSTAGDFRTGDPLRGGIELTAIAGDRFKSGDNFTIVAPTTDPTNPPSPINFVFDVDGSLAGLPNAIPINGAMTALEVRNEIRLALARVLNGDLAGNENVNPYPVYQNTVRLFNHLVVDSGPLHATTNRGADKFGAYTGVTVPFDPLTGLPILGDLQGVKDFQRAFQATQNNAFEGVYIDDIIIGFAERGEQVLLPPTSTAATAFIDTPFYENIGGPLGAPTTQTEAGAYQLEIRTAAEYGDQGSALLALQRSFDTNERLSNQVALFVSQSIAVNDGDTFTIDDGYSRVTFEFDIQTVPTAPSVVVQGNIPVPLVLPLLSFRANSGIVARAIRDAINSPAGQSILRITAGLRGEILGSAKEDLHSDPSNIVELFARDGSLPIASISSTSVLSTPGSIVPNALSDAFAPHPLDPFGVAPTLYPPIQVAGVYIYGKEAKFGLNPFGEDLGDSNRYRDQGQLVISSNTIRDSAEYGIVVDASATGASASNPNGRQLPGVVRNLVTLNTENLTPGAVIVNNLLIRGGNGGILLSGGGAATQAGVPPFTVARVINNTIYGGAAITNTPTGTGILVNQGASPTLINNIIANNNVGISAGSLTISGANSTVSGGNLFSRNNTPTTPGSLVGTFDIFLTPTETLFNDLTNDKFYLSAQSRAIDSSLGSLIERPGLSSVKSGIGRLPNPMIAPDRDLGGVLRVDEPAVLTPAGQGQNVYIDRGAVDRSDFAGPIAILRRPLDNSVDSGDINPNVTYVKLNNQVQSLDYFEILLDESQGTGVDARTVTAASVLLTENGRLLIEGLDYIFGYSANSRTIRLTPLSGIWRNDSAYEVTLNNKPRLLVSAPRGDAALDGTQLVATRSDGTAITFEYETGFALQVPLTSTLEIPLQGSSTGGLKDGDTFSISFSGSTVNFELTTDATTLAGNQAVLIPNNASTTAVRDAILAVLVSPTANIQSLQLSPKAIGSDRIHLGTNRNHLISLGTTNLSLSGVLEGVVDGQTFTYTSGTNPSVRFEFNTFGSSFTTGNQVIPIAPMDTNADIAAKIAVAMKPFVIGGSVPVLDVGQGVVRVGGRDIDAMDLSSSPKLVLLGTPGVAGKLRLQMPASGAAITDGQFFSLRTSTGAVTFEFTKDAAVTVGNRAIFISNTDSAKILGNKVRDAVNAVGLTFLGFPDLATSALGVVSLNEPTGTVFTPGTAPLSVTGVGGGAVAIPVIPSSDYSEDLVAGQIIKAINALPKPQFQSVRAVSTGGGSIVLEGIDSVSNLTTVSLPTIVDFAGNLLQGNRANGFTQFTIAMPSTSLDFGDAPFQTLSINNGASHVLYPVDVAPLVLGTAVDTETDGKPFPLTDSDDGIAFLSQFNALSPAVVVDVTVIGTGFLDAWIDWNGNSVFDFNEKVIDSQPVTSGVNKFSIPTLSTTVAGNQFARFRLSSTGGLEPTGMAVGGEVEDYLITIYPGNPPVANNDPAIAGGYSINEDSGNLIVSAPGILSNDTDLDAGETATLTVFDSDTSVVGIQPLSGPTNGTLLALNSNGSFTYRPKPNFAGIDTFTYYAVDSTGLRSVSPTTVTINVVEVNDVPEFTLPSLMVQLNEDETNIIGPVGLFSVANFATGIQAGPATAESETSQQLTFNVSVATNQQRFFAVAPTISSAGLLSFKLAPNVNRLFANGANIPIVLTLSDNGTPIATSAPQTFTIDIVPVNDDPIANGNRLPNVFSTFEDSPITLTEASITANDSAGPLSAEDELANQALTIVTFQATTSAGGTVNLLSTNSFNYRPAANFVGLDTFTYTISDGIPGSTPATATITIDVKAVNDAPTFTIPVTTIDVLEDQGSTISSTGVQTQVPISFPGFAINVAPGPISAVDEQGQQLDFIVQALDPSFYLVQPTIVRDTVNPSRAILTFTLNPHLNRNTPVGSNNRIIVSLQDRGPNNPAILPPDPNARPADVNVSTTQTFSINIIPVNDPPVPATLPSPFSATEDTVLTISRAQLLQPIGGAPALTGPIQATDEAGQLLSITRIDGISARGGVLSATLDGNGAIASILYRPSNNYVGLDSFTYTLSDDGGGSNSTTVTVPISVAPVNDAPVFLSGGNVLVNEDSPAYSLPWATGVAVGPSSALDELNGNVSLGIEAQSMLPFTVSTTSPELFLIAPAINATGVLTFQLRPNVIGNAVVSVRANDSGSGVSPNVNQSNETFFTISINPVNDAPVFIPGGNVAVLEDAGPVSQSWATGILPAAGLGLSPQQSTDESNQTVSFIVTNNNSVLFDVPPAIDSNGRLTFITKLNANGSALVTAFARDTGSGIAPNVSDSPAVTFTITLTPVNDAPIGVDDRYSTNEDSQLISTANRDLLDNDFDPDGDSFVAIAGETVSTNGASVTINADGTFVYDPRNAFAIQALPNGQSLSDTFTYRLRDVNNAESQFTTVTVTVIGINDAPRTMDDSLPVVFNQTTILDVLANDIDIDSVINRQSLVIGLVPLNGRVTVLNDGTISYVPNTGYRGGDSFTYQVRDDLGAISRETTVQLLMNSAPVANPDSTSLVVGTVKTIDVVANDRDPDIGDTINRQSVVIVSQSPNGSAVVLANGNIEFTPNPGFTGSALVTYTVADNKGLRSNPGNVSIDVVSSLYQNPKNKFDVNNDGFVSPIDALIVINYLNTRPVPPLETTLPPNYLDVDGSGFVSAVDILQVINFLNDRVVSRSAEGEAGDISQLQSLAKPSIDLPLSGTIDVEVLDQKSVQAYVQGQLVNSTTADKSRKALLAGSGTLDYLDFGDESIVSSVADELSTSGLRGNNVSVGSILDGVLDELGI